MLSPDKNTIEEIFHSVTPSSTALPNPAAGIALVVEDDSKSAQLIQILLERQGFLVLHAPSAEAALILASEYDLSLITLDIKLPGMNGWEFLVRLKRVPEFARVPAVIISGIADRERGLELGAAAVLLKPMRRQEFQDTFIALGLFPAPEQPL